jgi:hypothetical protein
MCIRQLLRCQTIRFGLYYTGRHHTDAVHLALADLEKVKHDAIMGAAPRCDRADRRPAAAAASRALLEQAAIFNSREPLAQLAPNEESGPMTREAFLWTAKQMVERAMRGRVSSGHVRVTMASTRSIGQGCIGTNARHTGSCQKQARPHTRPHPVRPTNVCTYSAHMPSPHRPEPAYYRNRTRSLSAAMLALVIRKAGPI